MSRIDQQQPPGIFLFISGFAGTGKTTLVQRCRELFPEYACHDFDEWFLDADGHWGIEISPHGHAFIQARIDAFIAAETRPIILAGVNMLNNDLHAKHQIVLDTSPWTVVKRLWHRATLSSDECRWWALLACWPAWRMRRVLIRQGFIPMASNAIIHWIAQQPHRHRTGNHPTV